MISPIGVMIIDNGPGLGMAIGVKKPAGTETLEFGGFIGAKIN